MYKTAWFNNLIKPMFTPPEWVFAPVWTVLYSMMGVAFIIYVLAKHNRKKNGYLYFCIQLFLNLLWSPVFFISKNISLALLVIIFLDIFVYLTIKEFYKISKIASMMLVPYFLWILFATYLNIVYLVLN